MIDPKKLTDDFKSLSVEDKKKKLILMLDWLKNSNSVFQELLDTINSQVNLSESFLIWVYSDIIEMWNAVETYQKDKELELTESLKEKMRKLHDIEAQERKDEDPDSLLATL